MCFLDLYAPLLFELALQLRILRSVAQKHRLSNHPLERRRVIVGVCSLENSFVVFPLVYSL